MNDISRGSIRIQGLKNAEMDFQLLRQLGASAYRGASVGECFNLAQRIQPESPEQWVNAFEQLATWLHEDGLERLRQQHIVSGRDQLWRASLAYRAAEYYAPCTLKHHQLLGLQSADCFRTAISTLDCHFESHSIPYKTINIPAYFISPANDGKKRKTLMIVSGFDGTIEEEFIMRGWAGVERGYNVIHFAGPGQMDVFRQYSDTYFEPDFENVLRCVIDAFNFREEIDDKRLALLGISIGGYLATRAASREPRIKALIANSPILDVHAYLTSFIGFDPSTIPDEDDFTIQAISYLEGKDWTPELKVRLEQLLVRYGHRSFKQTFQYLKQFTVGEHIHHLKMPCLALIGAAEGQEPFRQYEAFCAATEANHYSFSDFEGASTHCQVGNVAFANAVMYDWLDNL